MRKVFSVIPYIIRRIINEFPDTARIRLMYAGDPDDISALQLFSELIVRNISGHEGNALDYIEQISSSEDIKTADTFVLSHSKNIGQIKKSILLEAYWSIENNILRTPTYLVNGIEIPLEFDSSDLRNFIHYSTQELE